jgi:hypothetical protein
MYPHGSATVRNHIRAPDDGAIARPDIVQCDLLARGVTAPDRRSNAGRHFLKHSNWPSNEVG